MGVIHTMKCITLRQCWAKASSVNNHKLIESQHNNLILYAFNSIMLPLCKYRNFVRHERYREDIGKTLLRQRVKQVNKSELNFFWALDPS